MPEGSITLNFPLMLGGLQRAFDIDVPRRRGHIPDMVLRSSINRAVEILVREARPKKIILFGSYARNEENEDSDVDFFVIEKTVADKRREMVRLRNALRPLKMPVDLMVSDEATVKEWGDLPGTTMYWALKEGRVLYESA